MTKCHSKNPATGSQCVMAEGHAGPHCTGGPYRSEMKERWVTKCTDRECVYHETFVSNPGFEECLFCGDRRECRPSLEEGA